LTVRSAVRPKIGAKLCHKGSDPAESVEWLCREAPKQRREEEGELEGSQRRTCSIAELSGLGTKHRSWLRVVEFFRGAGAIASRRLEASAGLPDRVSHGLARQSSSRRAREQHFRFLVSVLPREGRNRRAQASRGLSRFRRTPSKDIGLCTPRTFFSEGPEPRGLLAPTGRQKTEESRGPHTRR